MTPTTSPHILALVAFSLEAKAKIEPGCLLGDMFAEAYPARKPSPTQPRPTT